MPIHSYERNRRFIFSAGNHLVESLSRKRSRKIRENGRYDFGCHLLTPAWANKKRTLVITPGYNSYRRHATFSGGRSALNLNAHCTVAVTVIFSGVAVGCGSVIALPAISKLANCSSLSNCMLGTRRISLTLRWRKRNYIQRR